MTTGANRRVLLIDDTPSIHEDFRKILAPPCTDEGLHALEAELFGQAVQFAAHPFELDSAPDGQAGVAMAQAALQAGRPYALAFVDMRMEPGWDGVETIEQLWRVDPRIQVVICTAYSDHPWEQVMNRLDVRDRLLVLKKPFDVIEVGQLARTLTAKWEATRQAQLQLEALAGAMKEVQAGEAALRDSHQELETLVHSLSHDLRAPLTAMSSFSQLLGQELGATADGKALHYLSRIRANAGVAERLIENLLLLEGVSRAELSCEAVDLGALARELMAEHGAAPLHPPITLSVPAALWVWADRNLARIAFRQLLANARRFTASRADARVELGSQQDASGESVFFVRDNGIGFDMAYADQLFRKPQRLHQGTDAPGSGVGLIVVGRIIGRMGGRIWVTSSPDAGTTVYFTLPVSAAPD